MPAPKSVASALDSARVIAAIRAAGRALAEHLPVVVASPRVGDDRAYCERLAWVFQLSPRAPGEATLGEQLLRDTLTTAAVLRDGPRKTETK